MKVFSKNLSVKTGASALQNLCHLVKKKAWPPKAFSLILSASLTLDALLSREATSKQIMNF